MRRVRVYRRRSDVETLGELAKWRVSWYEDRFSRTRSFPPGEEGRRRAHEFRIMLIAGSIHPDVNPNAKWSTLIKQFRKLIYPRYSDEYKKRFDREIGHFERVCRPIYVRSITSTALEEYAATRLSEEGIPGQQVVPASVKGELSTIMMVLKKGVEWDMMLKLPSQPRFKVPEPDLGFVTLEDFSRMYDFCDVAKCPKYPHVPPGVWWRGFLTFLFMTGWRKGQALALKWNDTYLEKRLVLSWASQNKGKRPEYIPIHKVVVEHLIPLRKTYKPLVFPWGHELSSMRRNFVKIQEAAGLRPTTPGNKPYSFHDLRRGFATANRDKVTPEQLQRLMQHKNQSTTKRYIKIADSLSQPVGQLALPDCFSPTTKAAGEDDAH